MLFPRLFFRFLWFFSLAGFLHAPVALSEPKFVTTVEGISEYRLDNGLRVLLFPEPASPTLTVNVTYLVGSRHEGYGETGMAHLLEHLVFKNTKEYSGKDGRKTPVEILNELGGRFNGTTSNDRTNYFISVPASKENLEKILSLEAERMGNSLLDPKDLWDAEQKKGEMTVVRNEFESGENQPISVTLKRLLAVAFDWHNYGKSTIGARTDIEKVSIEQIRAFYQKYYQPDNAVLLVAGQMDEKETLALVERYFGPKPRPERVLRDTYTLDPGQDGERTVEVRRVGDTPLVMTGYKIPVAYGMDGVAADLLSYVMTEAPSGRLYKALVEKKLASRVSGFRIGYKEPGLWITMAMLPTGGDVKKVKGIMEQELEGLGRKPVTQAELDRARQATLAEWEQYLAQPSQLGIALSEYIAQGDWRLFFVYRDLLEKAKLEDLQRVASQYLKSNNRTVAQFLPTKKTEAVAVAPAESLESVLAQLKSKEGASLGEVFDVSPAAIEARVQRLQMKPGLNVALLPKKTRQETVSGIMILRLGNEASLQKMATIGQVVGSMLMRGTTKRDRQAIKDELDRRITTMATGGSGEAAWVVFKTRKKHLKEILGLLHEVLTEPSFDAKELSELLAETKTAIEYGRSDPRTKAQEAMGQHLSPYPRQHVRYVENSEESLQSLVQVKRADLVSFHKNFYGAHGQLALVGDFDAQEVVAEVSRLFGQWASKKPYERIRDRYHAAAPLDRGIPTPGKPNAFLTAALSLELADTHPDYPALYLGNYMLGGGTLKSRLADRIRQKEGLSYSVASNLSASSFEPAASWSAYAIFNPANGKKVESALREELANAVASGFTKEELDFAKQSLFQAWRVTRANDGDLARLMAQQMHAGRTWTFQDQLEQKISALTPEEVAAAVRKYLDPARISVIKAGDFAAAATPDSVN